LRPMRCRRSSAIASPRSAPEPRGRCCRSSAIYAVSAASDRRWHDVGTASLPPTASNLRLRPARPQEVPRIPHRRARTQRRRRLVASASGHIGPGTFEFAKHPRDAWRDRLALAIGHLDLPAGLFRSLLASDEFIFAARRPVATRKNPPAECRIFTLG